MCDEQKLSDEKEVSTFQTIFRLFRCTLTVSQKLAKLFGEFTKQVHLVSVTDLRLSIFLEQCRYPEKGLIFFHSHGITFERVDGHKKILISIIKKSSQIDGQITFALHYSAKLFQFPWHSYH